MAGLNRWWTSALLAAALGGGSFLLPRAEPPVEGVHTLPLITSPSAIQSATPSPSPTRTSPKPKPTFKPFRIAATDPKNELDGVEAIDCPSCASGSRVQYVGQGHSVRIHLRDVPVAGRRTLVIVYESEGTRPLDVVLDGGKTISLSLPGTGNWVTPAQVRVPIEVPAGDSTLTFFHATAPAVDLDQFRIS